MKTELNFVLLNLIINDLFIVFVGVPLDFTGAFSKGEALNSPLCQATAFVHTLFGILSKNYKTHTHTQSVYGS